MDTASKIQQMEAMLNKLEADLNAIALAKKNSKISYPKAGLQAAEDINAARENISFPQQTVVGQSGREQEGREQKMEMVLHDIAIEISLEYFMVHGHQTFEIISESDGRTISKLDYPISGEIPLVKGEVTFLPGVSVGGKYATSILRKSTCSDEDWGFWGWHNGNWKYIDYQITEQDSKSKVEFYDVNLYYNLLNSAGEDKAGVVPNENSIYRNLLIDKLSLDIFAGYQSYKGRYRMMDPTTEYLRYVEGSWWQAIGLPLYDGLDSFYKIEYKGPRLGLRARGTKGKVTTKVSLACSWLETKAHGWWNKREYSFWQTGKSGLGTDLEMETTYAFTPSFSAGLGYSYFAYYQHKLKESGIQTGYAPYDGLDIVRNANSKFYGPKFILTYIW